MSESEDQVNQQRSAPRRTTRAQSKNTPNSKVLNAAWRKAPSIPTRKSHIKAVNHDEFKKSWNEWRQHAVECNVEDMEVDVQCDASTKSNILTSSSVRKTTTNSSKEVFSKPTEKNTGKLVNTSHEHTTKQTSSSSIAKASTDRNLLRARRPHVQTVGTQEAKTEIEMNKGGGTKPKKDERRKSNAANNPLFIVIHASHVCFATYKGPATKPVKVYADKFIVYMEDETSKKEVAFRVPCKDIEKLNVSLQEKPYVIEFTTKVVHYISTPPHSRKSKGGQESMNVSLHLGYDDCVPSDIKEGLKELFQVRLAEQNLWIEDDDKDVESPSKRNVTAESTTQIRSGKVSNIKSNAASYKDEKKNDDCTDSVVRAKEASNSPSKPSSSSTTFKQKTTSLPSVRKRTPAKLHQGNFPNDEIEPLNENKIARRSNTKQCETLEERLKTLEHEAAHYQMLTAQQRMIIQSLESDAEVNAEKAEEVSLVMKQQQVELSQEFMTKKAELTSILNNLKIERDLVKALESRIETLQKELETKDSIIDEKNNALQVREQTILQLRTRVRRLSTADKEDTKQSKDKKDATTLAHAEEMRRLTRQLEQLNNEIQHARIELSQKNFEMENIQRQLQAAQNDSQMKSETIERITSEYRAAQTDLANKNARIRTLEANMRTQAADTRVQQLLSQHAESQILIEELQSEIVDLKARVDDSNQLRLASSNQNNDVDQKGVSRDWILERREIVLTEGLLGTGAWGNVKVGKFRGTEVAVKQIHHLILSPHNRRLFEREMAIASRCRHPCLVQFIGATNDDGTPLFVMELLTTDLRTVLRHNPLDQSHCLTIGYDVIRAIVYLHKSKPLPIIHRDISSSNVLLYHGENNAWRAKLSDYGAANFLRLSMTRHPGGLLYSAPEASTMDQTTKLDVYSFGVLFCEMCTRELPVPENRRDQIRNVRNTEFRTLINNCLRRDIGKRFDSDEVLRTFEAWLGNARNAPVVSN